MKRTRACLSGVSERTFCSETLHLHLAPPTNLNKTTTCPTSALASDLSLLPSVVGGACPGQTDDYCAHREDTYLIRTQKSYVRQVNLPGLSKNRPTFSGPNNNSNHRRLELVWQTRVLGSRANRLACVSLRGETPTLKMDARDWWNKKVPRNNRNTNKE